MSENVVDTTTPTGGDTSAPAAPSASPSAFVAQPTTPAAPSAPSPNDGPPATEPSWLKGRLDQARQAAVRQYEAQRQSEWSRKEADYQARLEQTQRQLQSLVGVTPPQNPEIDAIRQQFAQVFPDEWKLMQQLKEKSEQLNAVLERSGDYDAQLNHYWESYGRNALDRLYSKTSEALGSALTNDGKQLMHSAFVGYLQRNPELEARYMSDPSVVDDFVKAYTSNFVDPVRRSAASQTVQRVPQGLPQDAPSGAPRPSAAPQLQAEERGPAAWALFNQVRNKP